MNVQTEAENAMRLLVIEDDRNLADALLQGLQDDGFAVDLAHNGNDGLWLANEHSYDAIVCDIMLPGVNGFQICDRLRAEGNQTPILMLTAKEGDLDEAEALDAGADDYLTKPFSFVVLLARLRALMRRVSGERRPVLVAGDLSLDPAQHVCQRGSTSVALTPKEFAIVEYLLRRKGEVVTKSEIVEHVWNKQYDGDPNVVEVYVSNIRRKIDAPFDRSGVVATQRCGRASPSRP
jgi:DNA-binding response OmpR family regulator